jgi:hypothetical protein
LVGKYRKVSKEKLEEDGVELNDDNICYDMDSVWEDKSTYVKDFLDTPVDVTKDLSVTARNMIDYVKRRLKPNNDKFTMHEGDFLKMFGYSEKSIRLYYTAVLELVERGIIAKVANENRSYFVNPNVMFNGSRKELFAKQKELMIIKKQVTTKFKP